MADTLKEGWNFLWNSKRSHFFKEDGKSMCSEWFIFGSGRHAAPLVNPPCARCKARLARREKRKLMAQVEHFDGQKRGAST